MKWSDAVAAAAHQLRTLNIIPRQHIVWSQFAWLSTVLRQIENDTEPPTVTPRITNLNEAEHFFFTVKRQTHHARLAAGVRDNPVRHVLESLSRLRTGRAGPHPQQHQPESWEAAWIREKADADAEELARMRRKKRHHG